MSALDFHLDEEKVVIVSDTLAISSADRKPLKFTTKFFPVPHMNSVICGTGLMEPIVEWFAYVQKISIATDIIELNDFAASEMSLFMEQFDLPSRCTIYHFGMSSADEKFYGYAYRSTKEFNSEKLPYGVGIKPTDALIDANGTIDIDKHIEDNGGLLDALVAIIHQQKTHDDSCENCVGIGGEIQLLLMQKNNCIITSIEKFKDYDSALKYIQETEHIHFERQ